MKESNIPKIVKTIYIQTKTKKHFDEFDKTLAELGFNRNSIESITINPILIPSIAEDDIEEEGNGNILEVSKYLNKIKLVFNSSITSTQNDQSISSFIKYIDNLNMALDGKINFDAQGIIKDLENDYDVCYKTWEEKKKNELLQIELSDVRDENEPFDSYINRQGIDFSFKDKEKLDELTFYGSSEEFDKYYKGFGKKRSFIIDKNILRSKYETKINQKKIENNRRGTELQKKQSEIISYFEKKKFDIDRYFGSLKFKDYIDSKYEHCNMDIDVGLADENNNYLNQLYSYYDGKKSRKEKEWDNQISRAKWKNTCQAEGTLKCFNGHQLSNDPIQCGGDCNGNLYWVDGPSHYTVCIKCGCVSRLENIVCKKCKASVYCRPKFCDFIP